MSDIRFNADQWNSLSDKDQTDITNILINTGVLKAGDVVIADPSVPLIRDLDSSIYFPSPCKIACDVAAAAAAAACSVLVPEAIPACIAAAEIARNACRDEC